MQVKEIKDFLPLMGLWVKMYEQMPNSAPAPQAVYALSEAVCKYKDFLAIGSYEDDVLVGFVCGFAGKEDEFYFSGLYSPNARHIRPLFDKAERMIKYAGYKRWTAHTDIPAVASLYEKYGAKLITTKHTKEL